MVAFGVLLSSAGSSLIWPFQLIYISKTLSLPISSVATLISISSATGLTASFIGGAIADRFGRKPIMLAAQACAWGGLHPDEPGAHVSGVCGADDDHGGGNAVLLDRLGCDDGGHAAARETHRSVCDPAHDQ